MTQVSDAKAGAAQRNSPALSGSPTPQHIGARGPALSEALLVRLWAGQRFPESALTTIQGGQLRVLLPGRAGRGAGPDFRDAIIAPPSGKLLRGDVEFHLRASDFVAHGHAGDHRYDNLVLHVVFDACGQQETRLASGRSVPIAALGPWLNRRSKELAGWLERPGLWREPCHDTIARLGPDAVLAVLDNLGSTRFDERVTTLRGDIGSLGPAETLYRALLDALAYGGERSFPSAVASSLPYQGLSEHLSSVVSSGGRVVKAEQLLAGATPTNLQRSATRPANRTDRRLAGLARLLVRHHPLEPIAAEIEDWTTAAMIASWSAPPYIGRTRAIELLTNAVLPWAAGRAEELGLTGTADRARTAFAALPRPGTYGALSFLEANLLNEGQRLPLSARRQQGLLELYKSQCTAGGCGRCQLS